MKEWLPGLNKRHKWFKKEKDFKVGDVVLVLSTKSKQGKWILGRISDVFPEKESCTSCESSNWGSRIHSTNI